MPAQDKRRSFAEGCAMVIPDSGDTLLIYHHLVVHLEPGIVQTTINGEEPDGLSLAKITRTFPEDWRERRRLRRANDNCA